jgi:uncharacterized protein YdeI (YjbR/CyaY-like superfamily)
MKPTFFKTQPDFRRWFEKHHDTSKELLVGVYKKGSSRSSITWPESVDEALCFGWIDGIRRSIDDISYTIRFTPRKTTSTWSVINIRRAQELIDQGLMRPPGVAALQLRKENKSGIYSYEHRSEKLPEPYEKEIKRNKAAWAFFQAQSPWYRKTVGWWVVSAKKEETRLKRLAKLIEDSANGRTIGPATRNKKSK